MCYLSKYRILSSIRRKRGLTFVELLIVVSLVSIIGLALYNALANGIKVWEKSREVVIEEDIVVFFDKISKDLRNAYPYAELELSGTQERLSFPTIVRVPADPALKLPDDEYIDQIGIAEYYFDSIDNQIYKRIANYGKALNSKFGEPRVLVKSVENLTFNYIYHDQESGLVRSDYLKELPKGVEVRVEFSDNYGRRTLRKLINLAIDI